jgi:acyl carrier protein
MKQRNPQIESRDHMTCGASVGDDSRFMIDLAPEKQQQSYMQISSTHDKEHQDLSKEDEVIAMIKNILEQQGFPDKEVELSSSLYDDGIGLDSLCVAELSSTLEKTYGTDPYTNKVLPLTVSDILKFYATG